MPHSGNFFCNIICTDSCKVTFKNIANNRCLVFAYFQMILDQPVTVWSLACRKSSLSNSELIAPPHSFGDGFALPLSQRREHGDKDFAGYLRGVDVLFLEVDADAQRSQFPHRFQTLFGIASKT